MSRPRITKNVQSTQDRDKSFPVISSKMVPMMLMAVVAIGVFSLYKRNALLVHHFVPSVPCFHHETSIIIMDDDRTSSTSMEVEDELPSGSSHSSPAANVVPYTDNEHQELDKAVARRLEENELGNLEGREYPPSVAELVLVLHEVIRGDDRLDPKYLAFAVSRQLFNKYPSLEPKVADAWRTESYRHIRELGMCTNHE